MDTQVLTMLVGNVGGLGLFAFVVWKQLVAIGKRIDDHLTAMEKKKDAEIEVLQGVSSILAVLEERSAPSEGRTPVFGIRPLKPKSPR